jgi:hypothetical protein
LSLAVSPFTAHFVRVFLTVFHDLK